MLVEPDVAAVGPPQLCELLLERANPSLGLAVALGVRHQDCDAPHATWLLRACRERPRHRAAEQCDELAASAHSITSSATASRDGGTVSPSIRAICALMTSSNLVDCTTGKSAGLPPLRMRLV